MPRTRHSSAVTRRVRRWVEVTEYRCAWCGQWFQPRQPTARYCRPSHRIAADQQRRRLGLPTLAEEARMRRQAAAVASTPAAPTNSPPR